MKPPALSRRILTRLVVSTCLLIVLLAVLPRGMARLGNWLRIQALDLPQQTSVDALIVLGGNTLDRIITGVDLYKQGTAPRMALTGYDPRSASTGISESLVARDYAVRRGVPESAFTILNTTSTLEDARQISAYISRYDLEHIAIVSDWSHGRRALCTIRQELGTDGPALYFVPASTTFTPNNWWTQEHGIVDMFNETLKMGYYLLVHRIPMWGCYPGDANPVAYALILLFGLPLSMLSVEWVRKNVTRLSQFDLPNERSSHHAPTPRGGGLGIALTVLLLWSISLWVWPRQSNVPMEIAATFLFCASLIAAVGWLDDRRTLSIKARLLPYLFGCVIFILVVGTFNRVDIPLLGELFLASPLAALITVMWLVGFLNVFNFMDGIDGLAGSQAATAAGFWLLLFVLEGQPGLALLAGLFAMASLGFLHHNMPPARIFMGDVGSVFLGFSLAALPLMAYLQTGSARMPVVGVLFVLPFVLDGTLTILCRILRGENIFRAHRSHIYQRLVTAGKSHAQVTADYQLLALFSGVCGILYYTGGTVEMLLAVIAGCGGFLVYAAHALMVQTRRSQEKAETG